MGEIKPALAPEEWQNVERDYPLFRTAGVSDAEVLSPSDRHAAAAVALHGQPFGFTWQDVERLLSIAGEIREAEGAIPTALLKARELESVATRIAALLSPVDAGPV